MIQQYGQTTNFTIQYDDAVLGADKRAAALLAVIENEYIVQMDWFGLVAGFGTANRVTVFIGIPVTGEGNNRGYHADGSTLIQINAQKDNPNDLLAGDIVKAIFVAEFSEVLMSLTGYWNAGASNGEGLSRFCARERYPAAFDYKFGSEYAWWVVTGYPDWINVTEPTDTNHVSYGCALIFCYFLKSQLGFSAAQIARAGMPTLEQIFQKLTGMAGGYAAIISLLQHFFPGGSDSTMRLPDPFPLFEPGGRQLLLNTSTTTLRANGGIPYASGTARESFLGCGQRDYKFTILPSYPALKVTVSDIGFGYTFHQWSVNGVLLPSMYTPSVQLEAMVIRRDVNNPLHTVTAIETITLAYQLSDPLVESFVSLQVPAIVGQVVLNIEVMAKDRNFKPDLQFTAQKQVVLSTEHLVWEDAYYRDAKHCHEKFTNEVLKLASPFDHLRKEIAIIFTLPDPAPDNAINLFQLEMQYAFMERMKKYLPARMLQEMQSFIHNQLRSLPQLGLRLGLEVEK